MPELSEEQKLWRKKYKAAALQGICGAWNAPPMTATDIELLVGSACDTADKMLAEDVAFDQGAPDAAK